MLTIMAQEVAEQPAAIAATMEGLRPLRAQIARLVGDRQPILFVARGSSDNAAIYGRYLLEVHAGRTASLAAPSVATHYRSQLDLTGALVVCISQSGQTEEIVATQQWARHCGALTVGIGGDAGFAAAADVSVAGPDLPETVAPIALVVAGQLLAEGLARALGLNPDAPRGLNKVTQTDA